MGNNHKNWTQEEIDFIILRYQEGDSIKEIAGGVDRNVYSVRTKLSRMGIKRNLSSTHRKCTACKDTQPIENFYVYSTGKIDSLCKHCSRLRIKFYTEQKKLEAERPNKPVLETLEEQQARLGNKVCTGCKKSLPRTEYFRNGKHITGMCKKCHNELKKENLNKRKLGAALQGELVK